MCAVTNNTYPEQDFPQDEFVVSMDLEIISLDGNSSHVSNLLKPKHATLCAPLHCVIEQFKRSVESTDPKKSQNTSDSSTTQPNDRRERNRALTAEDYDLLILSQMEMDLQEPHPALPMQSFHNSYSTQNTCTI